MAADRPIVRAVIHPGIGIARVGNSTRADGYFIGPEVPYAMPPPASGYKDATGALKRQAARFRLFGYDQSGAVVQELTADDAAITWTVHVANKKAAWYNFEKALDIPEAIPCARRNAAYPLNQRGDLIIDPGPRSVTGRDQDGTTAQFDTGTFCGQAVYLGELRTDAQGRLLFLGGRGQSGTPFPHNPLTTYGNNNGWYDDISDGPVTAQVTLQGRDIPVDPAWVVVAPPNYAPDLISIQTMYSVMVDAYQFWWLPPVTRPSFTQDIYPILRRLGDLAWVNYGFHIQFGWGAPYDFLRPQYLAQLSSGHAAYREVRRQIFNLFRNPAAPTLDVKGWPAMYGDDFVMPSGGPRTFLALTATEYGYLQQWAAGDFVADWQPATPPPAPGIDDLPPAQRPATLDRAALEFCLGGPFHPGCEMTWPMRHVTMYYAPFRIRPRESGPPEPDYGHQLTPDIINAENGPLYANGPGDITRWMAVPWQADSASCRAGYEKDYDPYLPTFWPPRVPNHVLRAEEYARAQDPSLPVEERMRAFHTRATWLRGLKGHYLDWINEMVTEYANLGIVERHEGPADGLFPPVMYVESRPGVDPDAPVDRNLVAGPVEKVTRHRPNGRYHSTANPAPPPQTDTPARSKG
jgi:hypothetical protein